jgi:hypothetical protein
MKKFLMIALLSAPFLSFSQNKTTEDTKAPATDSKTPTTEPAGKGKGVLKEYNPEVIYGELITFENNGRVSLRMDFGRDLQTNLKDKDLVAQIETLRETSFTNIPDAINYLASQGYRLINSYNFMNGGRSETHFLFEKRIVKGPGSDNVGGIQKPPMNPTPRDPAVRPNDTKPAGKTDSKTDGKKK